MANKKSSSKKSSSSKTTKQVKKVVKKAAKKNPVAAIIILLVIVLAAGVAGYLLYNNGYLDGMLGIETYLKVNNATKTGEDEYRSYTPLNTTYVEKGATAIYRNKDVSDKIVTTYTDASNNEIAFTDIVTTSETYYYATYSISYEKFTATAKRKIVVADTVDMSINFLELGNHNTGDCTYIKAGDVDILIDAGSRQNSVDTIYNYLTQPGRVEDGKLEYVIATHAHQDHIAAFTDTKSSKGIFSRFEVETIIEFAQANTDAGVYKNYQDLVNKEVEAGATLYKANQFFGANKVREPLFDIAPGVTMEVLYQKFYDEKTSDENDYSVCTLFRQDELSYLFTGDLEEKGEASLVENNDLPEVCLFKGGHHGSKTSNTEALLSKIKPQTVCICCCAGNNEYTDAVENQFPTQIAINNISKYTDKVFVTTVSTDGKSGYTSMNGNIIVYSEKGKTYTVHGSNNDTLLKDTDWFKNNRTCPTSWN